MDYFAQQLINGLALGSIYGLIAIGYTMVYGIVGMINFAHGDIFMIGAFIALITFLILVSFGLTADSPHPPDRAPGIAMAITALYGWTVERIAYRPLRAFVPPRADDLGDRHVDHAAEFHRRWRRARASSRCRRSSPAATPCMRAPKASPCSLSNIQILVVVTTVVLMALFTGWSSRAPRSAGDMRACEQDRTMAALLGVDVDRTISMTFVIGAALAAVAGMMYLLYYGVIDFFIGFVAGIKAFTAAVLGGIGSLPGAMLGGLVIGLIETLLVGLLLGRVQGRRRVLDPDRGPDLPSDRPARPARSRKSLTGASVSAPLAAPNLARTRRRLYPEESADQRAGRAGAVLADDRRSHRRRTGRTTDLLDAVRRSRRRCCDRVRRQHRHRTAAAMVGTGRHGPRRCRHAVQSTLSLAGRLIAPVLLVFTFLVPVIFYNRALHSRPRHPRAHLRDARLGTEHRGRPRRPARPRLCRVLRGRRLFLRAARHHFGLSFWICLPLAGILAAFWGVLLGFPVLRLRGDYLAIVTLAFGEIIRLVLLNWQSVTGGPNGVSGIPRPTFFGIPLSAGDDGPSRPCFGIEYSPTHRIIFLFYMILALALLTNWVTIRLRRLPIGRAWEALREDEVACRSLGINTTTTKLTAFATGAMFGGFAGAFFATRQGFISPESFTFHESALMLAIVVLGGMGSQLGVVLAAIVMIGGFELFRGLDQYRMLVFGIAMVLLMIWRPRGLIGHRAPTVFLNEQPGDLVRPRQGGTRMSGDRHPAHGRSPDHALRRHRRRQRTLLRRRAAQDHRADRAERRRQDHRVQLHHRLLQADRRRHAARPSMTATRIQLERLNDFRISKLARVARTFQNIRLFPGMTALENLMVAQHNALMRASG